MTLAQLLRSETSDTWSYDDFTGEAKNVAMILDHLRHNDHLGPNPHVNAQRVRAEARRRRVKVDGALREAMEAT